MKSGHILFTKGHENKSTHGVGFLIHKSLAGNVINTNGISERIIQISLKVSKRYILVLTQVYAPTTSYTDEEVDYFYEQVAQCPSNKKNHYNVVIGDFNAKVGKKLTD